MKIVRQEKREKDECTNFKKSHGIFAKVLEVICSRGVGFYLCDYWLKKSSVEQVIGSFERR